MGEVAHKTEKHRNTSVEFCFVFSGENCTSRDRDVRMMMAMMMMRMGNKLGCFLVNRHGQLRIHFMGGTNSNSLDCMTVSLTPNSSGRSVLEAQTLVQILSDAFLTVSVAQIQSELKPDAKKREVIASLLTYPSEVSSMGSGFLFFLSTNKHTTITTGGDTRRRETEEEENNETG